MTDAMATNETPATLPNPSDVVGGEGVPTSPRTHGSPCSGTTTGNTAGSSISTTPSSPTTTRSASVVTPSTSPIPIPKQALQRKPTPMPQDLEAMAAYGPLMAVINKEVSAGSGHIEPRTLAMIERRSRQISKDKLTKEAFMGGIPEEAINFESETQGDNRPKSGRHWLRSSHPPKDMNTLTEGIECHDGKEDASRGPHFLKRLKAPHMPFFRTKKTETS